MSSQSTTTHSLTKTGRSVSYSSVDLVPLDLKELGAEKTARVLWLLRPAVESVPEGSMSDLYNDAMEEEAIFWGLFFDNNLRGVLVTRILEYVNGYRVCLIQAAASDKQVRFGRDLMEDLLRYFEDWAEFNECDAIRISGRKGWGRVLKGFNEIERTYDKPLSKGVH